MPLLTVAQSFRLATTFLKEYIEERVLLIAQYIIDHNATVRQAAKYFGVSKSTVHVEVTKEEGLCG